MEDYFFKKRTFEKEYKILDQIYIGSFCMIVLLSICMKWAWLIAAVHVQKLTPSDGCEYPLDNTCPDHEVCYVPETSKKRWGKCVCENRYARNSDNKCEPVATTGKFSFYNLH